MSKSVKRGYSSSLREEQARQTRARIREAAAELFVERSYAGTTIAAIADAAAVAPQTVFAVFGSKAALLSEAIDVALAGDDEPVAVYDRPETQAVAEAPSAAGVAHMATEILQRAGRLIQVADAAALQDPELRPAWVAGHKGRWTDMKRLAAALHGMDLLREDVTAETAAHLLWVLTSPDTYCAYVVLLEWTPKKYERWLRDTIEQTIMA